MRDWVNPFVFLVLSESSASGDIFEQFIKVVGDLGQLARVACPSASHHAVTVPESPRERMAQLI